MAEQGGPLLRTRGFTFDGGFIAAGLLLAIYARRTRLDVRHLDAVAFGLPLGIAIGRIGDVINDEHHGAPSTSLLAVRDAHLEALTPDNTIAIRNYEALLAPVLALAVLAVDRSYASPATSPGSTWAPSPSVASSSICCAPTAPNSRSG